MLLDQVDGGAIGRQPRGFYSVPAGTKRWRLDVSLLLSFPEPRIPPPHIGSPHLLCLVVAGRDA